MSASSSEHDHADHAHHHAHHHAGGAMTSMAASATLHCLTGCAIGEIAGLVIGTAAGLHSAATVALSIALAFLFGYSLSTMPLLRAGVGAGAALRVVLAADTLSIATMEVTDNTVMALIPDAMSAGLVNVVFWVGMAIALAAAYAAAYPVNRWLLARDRGHALTHEYHHGDHTPTGWRRLLPNPAATTLAAVLAAFMLGGLVVSVADELGGSSGTGVTHGTGEARGFAVHPEG